jgi:hypothetical protein
VIETCTPEEVASEIRDSNKNALSGIIAIDGKDGAGKDCLAQNLRKLVGGGIVSLDCFIQQKNQGVYVPYLDLAAIRAAIEACATPKIIAGCCMLEVLNSTGHRQDILIYAKRVTIYPDRSHYYWLDDDMLNLEEPVEKVIISKNYTPLAKEIIRYHYKFKPLRTAAISFLHRYDKTCPFHLQFPNNVSPPRNPPKPVDNPFFTQLFTKNN